MNPTEFADRMRELADLSTDPEEFHSKADVLMCQQLSYLGFNDGVQVFVSTPRWYA